MIVPAFTEQGLLVDVAALAAVALVGYLFGRRRQTTPAAPAEDQLCAELARAQRLADELQRVASSVGIEVASHARGIAAFQSQLAALGTGAASDWGRLRTSADKLLPATLKLATSLTLASDHLRRDYAQLSSFSASRIDRPSGLHNRRSLEEQLAAFFSMHAVGKRRFALAMFSLTASGETPAATATGDDRLRQAAPLLEECIREGDFLARTSDDEFVVLMPQTTLAGALAFSERLLVRALSDQGCALWGGVVEAASDETPNKLLSRADSALYSAQAVGEPALFQHTGQTVRRHAVQFAACGADAETLGQLLAV